MRITLKHQKSDGTYTICWVEENFYVSPKIRGLRLCSGYSPDTKTSRKVDYSPLLFSIMAPPDVVVGEEEKNSRYLCKPNAFSTHGMWQYLQLIPTKPLFQIE